MIDLKGKVAVVFGLANKRSIAYSVAQKLAEAGAILVLSYQSERLQREAEELLEELGQRARGARFVAMYRATRRLTRSSRRLPRCFPRSTFSSTPSHLLRPTL